MTRLPLRVRAPSRWALQVLMVGLVAAIAGGAGCSDDDRLPALGGGGSGGRAVEAGPCSEGTTRPCGVRLATHGDVVTCFEGTQSCNGGAWQSCGGNGRTVERRLPSGSGGRFRPQAIGDAGPCLNNPCDPFCWNYPNEYPESALQAVPVDGGTIYPWLSGSPADLPPGVMKEPCESALDCQFNHRCDSVATDPTCGHDKCVAGAALSPTCAQNDACVDMICDQRASCCSADSCLHDVCTTGVKLDSSCSQCVASICAAPATAYCCTTGSWDAACVAAVSTTCAPLTCGCGPGEIANTTTRHCYKYDATLRTWAAAQTACGPPGDPWKLVSVNDMAENTFVSMNTANTNVWLGATDASGSFVWESGEPFTFARYQAPWESTEWNNTGDCLAMRGVGSSLWHDWHCDQTKTSFCEGPMQLSGRSWDSTCVGMIDSVCQTSCGSGAGNCVPWLPAETDPGCSGVDLAIGVPCAPPDQTVPVCNHGTVAAPSGVEIAVFPASSQQYPSCTPAMGQMQGAVCVTTQAIPPGECVNVSCPALTAGNQDTLMVNPPTANQDAECNCMDNWAIYDDTVACGPATCGGTGFRGTFERVNLFVLVNRASSMAGAKWTGTTGALTSFFQDTASTGIGVALEFFPIEPNKSAGSLTSGDGCPSTTCVAGACAGCDVFRCANPMISLAPLAFGAAPGDTQEARLIQALVVGTDGDAPSHPALEGTLNAALASHAANPNVVTAVIFATDGEPDQCLVTDAAITNAAMATLAASAAAAGVNTHTICIEGANCTALDAIAAAGGTAQARVVATGTAQADFLAALRAIAAENVSCTLALPAGGTFNRNNVSVISTNSSGTPQTLPRVQLAGNCGAGWYFDNNLNPTTITLCPTTCAALRGDFGATVDVVLGCPPVLSTTALTEVYDGICPLGSGPQWNFLAYDSLVPANTSLHFAVRTAATLPDLGMATFHAIADVPPDPAICAIGVAGCPADLYQPLGATDAGLRYLELAMTFTPSSNGQFTPTVNNWQLFYSCLPNQ